MRIEHLALKAFALLAFLGVCGAIFTFLFLNAGGNIRLSKPYTVTTVLPDAFQLVDNADVRNTGVKIGVVSGIRNRGSLGVVEIELDERYAPLYRDARVLLRTKTLVGENYLDVDPGKPSAGELPDGGTLPLDHTGEAVQLDQILSSFDDRTRRSFSRTLREFGASVEGRGADFNTMLAAARPLASDGRRAMAALRSQRRHLGALMEEAATVMDAFARRSAQIRTFASAGKATAEAVASRDREFGRFIEELPGTLRQARLTTDRLASLSGTATPVLADLRRAMVPLRPLLSDLGPAAADGRRFFDELPPLVAVANPLMTQLERATEVLPDTIDFLAHLMREATPPFTYLVPYTRELGAVLANPASMAATVDALGNVARIHPTFSREQLDAQPAANRRALTALLDTGAIGAVDGARRNPYPAAGSLATPSDYSGTFPRLPALPEKK